MVPLSAIYWFSIISMGFAGSNLVLDVLLLYKREAPPQIDSMLVVKWCVVLLNILLTAAALWAYRLKHIKWTILTTTIYLPVYILFSQLSLCEFLRCGEDVDDRDVVGLSNWDMLGTPKWTYLSILAVMACLEWSLTLLKALWFAAYVFKHRFFSRLWMWIERNPKTTVVVHIITILPTIFFMYNEVNSFAKWGLGNDNVLTTLFLGFGIVLSETVLTNGLIYLGVYRRRTLYLQIFIYMKFVCHIGCVILSSGRRHLYQEKTSRFMIIGASATWFFYILEAFVAYFYIHKLVQGWDEEDWRGEKKASWNLPIVPLNHITSIQTEPLGHGHTSTVYRCRIARRKTTWYFKPKRVPAALKTFLIQDTHQICHEFSNLHRIARLQHPNVVRFYGICIREQMVSAVFELCDQGSLKGYLRRLREETKDKSSISHLLLEQLTVWSANVANGMEFLANNGIIHGDLAARNVLLSPTLAAKISDFGLSHKLYGNRVYERLETGTVLPWRWMAPEVLSDWSVQRGSDVWSYGITLWEIFSLGEQPWVAYQWDSGFKTVLQNGTRPGCPRHAAPTFYADVMLPCWELDPNQRPSFALLKNQVYPASH